MKKVTVFNHLSARQPIVLNENQLEATVALQFQVLDAMDKYNHHQAQMSVFNRIQQVYQRDFTFFYSTDDPTQSALEELANGVSVLPNVVARNRIRFEKWVTKFVDGKFYLRDAFLAVFLSGRFKQGTEQLQKSLFFGV
jgi:hypothetical protein